MRDRLNGEITDAIVLTDRDTGRSRGFARDLFERPEAATAAEALDGTDLSGRNITVNEARARTERPRVVVVAVGRW